MNEVEINNKVNLIEKELFSLKLLLLKLIRKNKSYGNKLEGSLTGIKINEEEIKESKFSLFRN